MKYSFVKLLIPHLSAIIIFLVITFAYFTPMLEGEEIKPPDIVKYQGMVKEINDFKEQTGKVSLWTNSMFGGMPAYLISAPPSPNILKYLHKYITLLGKRPASFLFLYLIGFYIALLIFRVNPWLSIIGAIAFGFSSYFFIIIGAGHPSKAFAIGYMSPIIAGVYLAFSRKPLSGALIVSIFLSLQLYVNHLQITYYTFLLILIFGFFQLSEAILKKQIIQFFRPFLLLIFAVILAIGSNITLIWTTYEYGKYSTRSRSELTFDKENKTSGLDKDYILNDYSYGIAETFNLFIPNFVGGSHSNALGTKSETYNTLKKLNVQNARQIAVQFPAYWGPQRSTAGPVYIGAVIVFLFFFGVFIVKGKLKWWLVTATIFSILLAWGKHFMFLSEFFIDYFPGYNKFRTVSMILVIAEFAMPLLAILAIKQLTENDIPKIEFNKALKYSLIIVGGLALIFSVMPGLFLNFKSPTDQNLISSGWPDELLNSIRADRKHILQTDALRSFLFIIFTAAILLIFRFKKISLKIFYVSLGLLILLDLWTVNRRYLNNDNFVTKRQAREPYTATKADLEILNDKELDFRVLDLTESTFNSSRASYFHKSIGGYHGAKMKRYQELINFHIAGNIQNIINTLQNNPKIDTIYKALSDQQTLNMLNTKYIIYNQNAPPLQNPFTLGSAWFVKSYRIVDNSDEEILALHDFNPLEEAIIDKRFKGYLNDYSIQEDSTAIIQLMEYQPNKLIYHSSCNTDQLAVFSEIYYDKGWNVWIDGEPANYFRVNYVLRGMIIPPGSHEISFKFEPKSYFISRKIALPSSSLLLLLIIGIFIVEFMNWKKTKNETFM
jgi:hypothetical protein